MSMISVAEVNHVALADAVDVRDLLEGAGILTDASVALGVGFETQIGIRGTLYKTGVTQGAE